MISFIVSIIALVVGYFIYGKIVERIFGPDENALTPAKRLEDGVDYIEMSEKKTFLIQFLNIAGTGPIFGAVAGASTGNLNAAISGAMAIGGATSGLVDSHNIKSKQRRIAKAYNDFEQEHSELDAKSKVEYSRMLLDGEIEAKTDAEREYVEAMRDLNNVYERNGDSSDDAGDKIEKVIKRIQDGDISETSAPIRFYNSTKETGKKLANKIKQARNRNNAT